MLLIVLTLIFLTIWMVPGTFVARGLHSEQVRQIRSKPVVLVPPKPPRPRISLEEMLHTSKPHKCSALKDGYVATCNCKYRDDWEQLKNDWIDYNEWQSSYGHIKNGVVSEPKADVGDVLWAVPLWPIALGIRFIKGGEAMIPDYREIERLEEELKVLQ